jgi:hypothetical protein
MDNGQGSPVGRTGAGETAGRRRRRDRGTGGPRLPKGSLEEERSMAEGRNRPLAGRVALVTGASRGAGKGIALVLGEQGATVYLTGRSTRGGRSTLGRPGTIEDTAESVDERGGRGVAIRCDTPTTRRSRPSSPGSERSAAASTFWSTTPGAATRSLRTHPSRSGRWNGGTGTSCSRAGCRRRRTPRGWRRR